MNKLITLCFVGTMFSIQLLSQQLSNTFYFEKGSQNLSNSEKNKLKTWVENFQVSEIDSITLKSFCDADGSDEFNLKLADKRSESTRSLLTNEFNSIITTTKSIGEVGLEKELEKIKKGNRKVEITVHIKSGQPKAINQELTVLWKELKPKSQKFCIDPTRDTVLVLNGGSIISIDSYSFEQNNQPIIKSDDCLFLIIDEVLSKKESYLNSLTTQSNKSIIESAGMLNISAEYKGSEANLIKEKDLLVMLPTQKSSVGKFQMFSGERNPHNNEMNWLTDNNPEIKNISMNDYLSCGGVPASDNGGMYCRFFFCKIKRFFFPKKYNSGKSSYQPSSEIADINSPCGNIIELYKKYGVDNYQDLQLKMNEALMQKYDVDNLNDLKIAMKKERMQKMEDKFTNGEASFDDLRFMVYNTNNLGWANCDAFSDVPAISKTQLGVGMDNMDNIDVKLVFKKRNIILSPTLIGDKFYFEGVPKKEEVIVLAVKMQNNQPQVFMEEKVIGKDDVIATFEPVTIDELKNKLSVLDI